jgi:hypothetical protein
MRHAGPPDVRTVRKSREFCANKLGTVLIVHRGSDAFRSRTISAKPPFVAKFNAVSPLAALTFTSAFEATKACTRFAALGVVFGDIGTSPLYTLKTVLDLTGDGSPATVLGVLSLIVWTLIAITSIKYVTIAMRVDNDGEGGILALMALLGVKRIGCARRRSWFR